MKKENILNKRYDVQKGRWRLRKELLNSIYIDKIIDLFEKNDCIVDNFCCIAGGAVSFFTKADRKNAVYISVKETLKQRLSESNCPDWRRVFIRLEKYFNDGEEFLDI
jgi:hypothetical protein